jgi:hypothetical protein
MPIGTRESEFAHFDDGVYEVGFDTWFPLDEEGTPNLVTQERFGEEALVIRFRTTINGEEGPPGTIDPFSELLPLVRAFGGDPSDLRTEKDIGIKLLKAQKLMTGKTKVTVGNNWIQNSSIEGMGIPDGFYYLKLSKVVSKNEAGELGPIEGKYGPYVVGRAKITRGKFKDFEVTFLLDYPLVVGEEDGIPALPLKSDGTLRASSKRFKNYLVAFYGEDYVNFPHQNCEDVNNIMPLLTKLMLEREAEAMGQVEDNRINLNSLGPISEEEKELLSEEEQESSFTQVQEALRTVIISEVRLHKEADAFTSAEEWNLTSEGVEWAKEALGPIVDEFKLSRVFSEWSDGDIEKVLKALDYNKDGTKKQEGAQF